MSSVSGALVTNGGRRILRSLRLSVSLRKESARISGAFLTNDGREIKSEEKAIVSLQVRLTALGRAAEEIGDDVRRVNLDTLTPEEVKTWQAGDTLLLSGKLLTGRDAAHKKLTDMLEEMKISDIDAGEANRRRELNMVVTAMGQLLFLDYLAPMLPADYPREQVAQGLRDYMDNDWQNKDTGYWGAWYLQNGELVKTDDLSVTFHIISYRRGDVKLLDQLVDTTFSLRETKYPYGWQDRGTTNNHHNYDVTTILKYGWPAMDYIQKSRASAEIGIMLARSLRLTLDGQGRFYTDAYDNVGDAYYFGVSFLDAAGYFDPSKRFWARKLKFPESPTLKQRLIANMQALDSEDPMILLALQKLGVDTTSNGAAAADDPGSSD